MRLTWEQGAFCLWDGARPAWTGLRFEARFYNRFYTHEPVPPAGEWTERREGQTARFSCGNYTVEAEELPDGALLRVRFRNGSDAPLSPLTRLDMTGRWRQAVETCVYNERESWSFRQPLTMEGAAKTVRLLPEQAVTCPDYFVCRDAAGRGVLFGFATAEQYFGQLTVQQDGLVTASSLLESRTLQPGEELVTDWLALLCGADANACLQSYGTLLAERMHASLPPEIPTGWCSWYYYLGEPTPDEVLCNAGFLRKQKELLPVRYIQVDMGWFPAMGDWEENEKFSRGMRTFAEQIRATGFEPGIWLCPFSVAEDAKLVREHPDYLLQAPDGSGPYRVADCAFPYGIDPTSPGGAAFLERTFTRISREWGYHYIKLDFLISGIQPGRRYEPGVSTLQSFRRGLAIMRRSVTEDTFLLACTSPLTAAVGLADGMRVSMDIFEDWQALVQVFSRALKRYFYHGKAFWNDADCILVRESDSEDAYCLRKCVRTEPELRVFATCIAASGGLLMLSDKMPLLPPEKLRLLSKLFPPNRRAAVPLDLMETDCPGLLDFGGRERLRILAMVNWSDRPKTMRAAAGPSDVWEFWGQAWLGRCGGTLECEIPPHDARVFFLSEPAESPAVVGTDTCICPAIRQEYADGTLMFCPVKAGGRYWVRASDPPRETRGCALEGREGELFVLRPLEGASECRAVWEPGRAG